MSQALSKTRSLSLVAGLLITAGLPPWGWWPLTIAGLALWYQLLNQSSARRFGCSLIVGAAWLVPSTLWMADLTLVGWPIAVITFTVMIALVGWVTPSDRHAASFCAALTLVELLRWSWPFGGVPIATLAMVGVSTPLAPAATILGSLVLVTLMALSGTILAGLVQRRRPKALAVAVLVILPLAGLLPWLNTSEAGTIRVAVVQGGGPQNTRADVCQNRPVFERHMTASALINEPVDLVLWPEDVVHPSRSASAAPNALTRCAEPLLSREEATERIASLARDLQAVVVTGWFEPTPDRSANLNYVQLTNAEGGLGDTYHKVQLVPFGEFLPFRNFVERFSDEAPSTDVRAGSTLALLDSDLGKLGVAISWEVFFDHRARDAIGNGGAVLLNPTNGSSYWLTIVQSQQIASSRLRAIETDRWVLQAAPTGFSAVVNPAGEVVARTGVSEQRVLIETIELREGSTIAVVVGIWPLLVAAIAVVGFTYFNTLRLAVTQRLSKRKRFAARGRGY